MAAKPSAQSSIYRSVITNEYKTLMDGQSIDSQSDGMTGFDAAIVFEEQETGSERLEVGTAASTGQ